jgi:hypothetical protein
LHRTWRQTEYTNLTTAKKILANGISEQEVIDRGKQGDADHTFWIAAAERALLPSGRCQPWLCAAPLCRFCISELRFSVDTLPAFLWVWIPPRRAIGIN